MTAEARYLCVYFCDTYTGLSFDTENMYIFLTPIHACIYFFLHLHIYNIL